MIAPITILLRDDDANLPNGVETRPRNVRPLAHTPGVPRQPAASSPVAPGEIEPLPTTASAGWMEYCELRKPSHFYVTLIPPSPRRAKVIGVTLPSNRSATIEHDHANTPPRQPGRMDLTACHPVDSVTRPAAGTAGHDPKSPPPFRWACAGAATDSQPLEKTRQSAEPNTSANRNQSTSLPGVGIMPGCSNRTIGRPWRPGPKANSEKR